MTAHPKICSQTGELLAFGYGMAPPYLTYYRVSKEGQLVQEEEIEVPGADGSRLQCDRNYVIS